MKKFRLDGVVGYDFDAAYVASQLSGEGDVEVTLNTPGGDILEGMAIYNAFIDHAGTVTFVIDQAMSMGSIIMLAGDKRIGRRESTMIMIHRPWGMGMGDADEMRQSADILDKMQSQMTSIYMGAVNVDENRLAKMLDDETFLDAEEAYDLGLLTEVVSGSRNALQEMAFAALTRDKAEFDKKKFAAKVKQISAKATDFCSQLEKSGKLSEIESTLRARGMSRTEATAIVSAVKRVQGDLVGSAAEDSAAKALNFLNNFQPTLKV
jgi:ATP-dependent Clp endopeptidase proteolytic subunit ClpP